ncbi:MAG: amino acid permease [Spirochaetaceae bacterium]|nr:MAG: amino acid permease [Spirochaetaceae bacterium]
MSDSPTSERRHLKRNISLIHLIGIEVGQSIGAGIFALTGIALAATGPSLFLAFLAAAFPVALAMAVLAMLATAEPISGGTYYYGSRFFSPVASFTGVWAYILGAVLGMFPLYALTGATFLKAVIPALPKIPVALLLLAVFFLTNLLGARVAVWIQAVLVAILLLALFLFIGAGMPEVSLQHFSPLFTGGTGGFLVASAILTFTILGANAAVELGDEIIDPRKNIPRSFLIAIPVVTAVYVVIGIVAAGVAPWNSWSDSSLSSVAAFFLRGPLFVFFIVGGGFLAVVTTLNATYLWGTKSLILITEDGLFPKSLARINRRFGTPHWFLIIIFLISSAALIVAGERVETFAVFASLGGIIIFIPVMGAALRLRRHHPQLYARSSLQLRGVIYYLAPAAGLLLCVLVIAILLINLSSHRGGFVFLAIFGVWVAAGVAYSGLRLRRKVGSRRRI